MKDATAHKLTSLEDAVTETTNAFIGKAAEKPLAMPSSGIWHTTVHSHYEKLEKIWRKMEEEGYCMPFQTYDWLSCWYDITSAHSEAEPLILVVSAEGYGPVWILPLCIYQEKGLWIISFADRGIADYTAPVIAKNAPTDRRAVEAIWKSVFDALPPCDVINFQKIAEKVEERNNPLMLLGGLKPFRCNCHGILLREPWPGLAEKIMQSRLRSTIKRQKKKLSREGEVTIEYHTDPKKLAPILDDLIYMRQERFREIGLPEMEPVWQKFYKTVSVRKHKTIDISIATMSVSGEVIALCYGFSRGDTYYAILPTFQMGKWERFRPGMLLFDAMLTDLAEKKPGTGYFDFTVGDEIYKSRFGCEKHNLYEWMVPRSAAGLLYYMAWRGKVTLRRHPKILNLAKKFLNKVKSH